MGDLNAVANFFLFFFFKNQKNKNSKLLEEKKRNAWSVWCQDLKKAQVAGSRAPGRDGDQDGTHGEEDKRVSGLSAPAARPYLFHSTFFPVNDHCCYSNCLCGRGSLKKGKQRNSTRVEWDHESSSASTEVCSTGTDPNRSHCWWSIQAPELCSFDSQTVGPRLNLRRLKESFLRDLSIMLPPCHEQPPTYAAPHAHADVRDISKGLTDSLWLPLISCLLGGVTVSRLARLNQPKQKCDAQRAFKNPQQARL